ncbi:hypothetical protein [Pseudofrankia saprophytica]|uniref:hypothetical protein n=1 Tax=Pseudofrankia saprophytica TaxID=298655 RepID=UPI000234D145|nr:hypothetical protein [Pseudofrankia saprophytica]
MPQATGGLPQDPGNDDADAATPPAPGDTGAGGDVRDGHDDRAGYDGYGTRDRHDGAIVPAAAAGSGLGGADRRPAPAGPVGQSLIPVARRSPDDHPQDYPGLIGGPRSQPAESAPWPAPSASTAADAHPETVREETTPRTTPGAVATPRDEDDADKGASDRRQFHRLAAGAVMGALLLEGQILEVSGMLAASPVQLALERAEHLLGQALGAHEVIPPTHVLAQTARLHRGLERLARRRMADGQWKRLRVLAGRVAVLRADAAFKQGNVTAARVLTTQGYAAGLAAGDGQLCGSAREVGAVAEFYDGRPDEALRLARDGQRHVAGGPVRARLVCQEARALAGLGDVQGAARALDHAYDLADEIPPDRWGRPGPSFDEFNPVEVAYNATTALCLLGRPRAAEEHAELAMPKLDGMDAPGFRSVIRLDLSLALARAGRLELERACSLASEAIQISWGRTVASVSGRADQVLAATRAHSEVPEVRDLAALVREWQRSASEQGPRDGLPGVATAAALASVADGPGTPGRTLPDVNG